jgi:hypothetical protein
MAIKGKKKPKARSGRVVTPGPRPAYVPPKVPLFQRTGAKFVVALIAEALIFSLLVGFGEQSQADRQREKIGQFSALLDASLAPAGDAIQPFPGGAQVLPQLPTRLGELQAPEAPDPDTVIGEAASWSSALNRAADRVATVQVPQEDLDPDQRLGLTEARNLIQRGLRVFAGLADQLRVAAQIDGSPQTELITAIQTQLQVAGETFQAGYDRLANVRSEAGLEPPAAAPGGLPAGGLPGGGLPAGGLPGGLPPGFDPTMPGVEVVPEPIEEGGGGNQGGGDNEGGGGNG